jgi:hypothetical protein
MGKFILVLIMAIAKMLSVALTMWMANSDDVLIVGYVILVIVWQMLAEEVQTYFANKKWAQFFLSLISALVSICVGSIASTLVIMIFDYSLLIHIIAGFVGIVVVYGMLIVGALVDHKFFNNSTTSEETPQGETNTSN